MLSPKAPLATTLVALAMLTASAAASPAADAKCSEAVSPAGAQKIFDGLAAARPSDGCTLENVTTDRSQMRIEWKKDGRMQEAILVVPSSCANVKASRGKMTSIVPSGVEAACPGAVEATRKLVDTVGELVELTPGISDHDARRPEIGRRSWGLLGGGLATALAAGGGLVALRLRRRRRAQAQAITGPKPEDTEAKADQGLPHDGGDPHTPAQG